MADWLNQRRWFLQQNWTANELPPSIGYHFDNQPTEFYIFEIISAATSLVALTLAVIQFFRFRAIGNQLRRLRLSVFLPLRTELLLSIAIFPALMALSQFAGLIFVRQARLTLLLADLCTSSMLWAFWSFLVGISGGAERVVKEAGRTAAYRVYAAAPLCFVGLFLKKRHFMPKDLRRSRLCVWQFTILVPISSLVRAFNNGVVNIDQLLNYMTIGSMLICMWGLHVLTKAAERIGNDMGGIRLVVEAGVTGTRVITLISGIRGIVKARNSVYTENVMKMAITNFSINILSTALSIVSFKTLSPEKLHKEEITKLEELEKKSRIEQSVNYCHMMTAHSLGESVCNGTTISFSGMPYSTSATPTQNNNTTPRNGTGCMHCMLQQLPQHFTAKANSIFQLETYNDNSFPRYENYNDNENIHNVCQISFPGKSEMTPKSLEQQMMPSLPSSDADILKIDQPPFFYRILTTVRRWTDSKIGNNSETCLQHIQEHCITSPYKQINNYEAGDVLPSQIDMKLMQPPVEVNHDCVKQCNSNIRNSKVSSTNKFHSKVSAVNKLQAAKSRTAKVVTHSKTSPVQRNSVTDDRHDTTRDASVLNTKLPFLKMSDSGKLTRSPFRSDPDHQSNDIVDRGNSTAFNNVSYSVPVTPKFRDT